MGAERSNDATKAIHQLSVVDAHLVVQAYDDLFHGGLDNEENLDELLEDDFDGDFRQRRRMSSGQSKVFL